MPPNNLALIGFMGVGKTTIGRMLADKLEYTFCDTDQLIQQAAGKSIPQIFEEDGEAVFRQIERRVIADIALSDRHVISTGGGVALDPENVNNLRQNCTIFLLIARAHEILRRIGDAKSRPLLAMAQDPKARIEELLTQRMPRYASAADHMIITSGKYPTDVCAEILNLFTD